MMTKKERFKRVFAVLLHPLRTLQSMDKLEQEVVALKAESYKLETSHRSEMELHEEKNRAVRQECARTKEKLEDTLRKLEEAHRAEGIAKRQLEEMGEMHKMVSYVDERLKEAETIKADYEQRLRVLKDQLQDTRQRLRRASIAAADARAALPQTIDMQKTQQPLRRKPRDPDSWFEILPDDL